MTALAGGAPASTTTNQDAFRRSALRRSRRGVARYAIVTTWTVGRWFWAIAVTVLVVGTVVVLRMAGPGDFVIVNSSGVSRIFAFVLGIIVAVSALPVHLAAGGTRRTWQTGLVAGAGAIGVTFAVAIVVVNEGQWWLTDLLSGSPSWASTALTSGPGGWLPALWEQAVFCTVYWLTGAAVGMAFFRLRGTGVFTLPLLAIPVALAEMSVGGNLGHWLAVSGPAWTAVSVAGDVLAVVLAALALVVTVHGVTIRPRPS